MAMTKTMKTMTKITIARADHGVGDGDRDADDDLNDDDDGEDLVNRAATCNGRVPAAKLQETHKYKTSAHWLRVDGAPWSGPTPQQPQAHRSRPAEQLCAVQRPQTILSQLPNSLVALSSETPLRS